MKINCINDLGKEYTRVLIRKIYLSKPLKIILPNELWKKRNLKIQK